MNKFFSALLLFVLGLQPYSLLSQEMPITGADINQCGGFLVDDGLSSGNYSNNLDETITLCAPAPETIINLYFAVFALGANDYMEIYDGPNVGSPLIGTYFGNELQTTDITSTNGAGCLTVRFVSDDSGVGNFGAEISCGPPCERPFAVINSNEGAAPIKICPGETVTFNAAATTFANGASFSSITWDFDDGTTSTAWPSVSHTFNEPGGYVINAEVNDNNDCHSVNRPDYVVLVSTYPNFSLMTPEFDLCVGGNDWLGVNFNIPDSIFSNDSIDTWISRPWIDLPDINLGGALFIPDDQSECFSDEVTFTNFDLNQTITSANDILNFYINFEHSFMGDITITYVCPNGSSVIVHQQGGGGTSLGEPVDVDTDLTPGVGYDYFWSPSATNGTWADNASGTLPAGTYESVQSFDNLIGCPLNGTWEIEVCDMWASDNGYIFDWGLAFNPNLYGELLQFEPSYGPNCDSTYWEGPNVLQQSDGCDFIQISLNETGSYPYTYFATNDFGCTFDTTIVVNVFVAPNVNAGPDLSFNCAELSMGGSLDGETMDYVWSWSPATGLSNPNIPNPQAFVSSTTTYTLTGYPVGHPTCVSTDEMTITLDPSLDSPGIDTELQLCESTLVIDMFESLNGNPTPGGYWTDGVGNTVDQFFDPTTEMAGDYFYNIQNNDCLLSARLSIITELPEVVAANDTIICISGTASLRAWSPSDPDNTYVYTWSTGDVGSTVSINPTIDQYYYVQATNPFGCQTNVDSMLVSIRGALQVHTNESETICPDASATLSAENTSGGLGPYTYSWTFNGTPIGNGANLTHSPGNSGQYCVTVSDACETPSAFACRDVVVLEPVTVLIASDTTRGCSPLEVQISIANNSDTYASATFEFSDSSSYGLDSVIHTFAGAGSYDVLAQIVTNEGCRYTRLFDNYITVLPNPVAAWTANPQPADVNNTEINFLNESSGIGLQSQWTFNQPTVLGMSNAENPSFIFPLGVSGVYPVSLRVRDANNCTNILTKNVIVNDVLNVYIPNTFTPNNDGINDVFEVKGTDIDDNDFELVVFNRWGEMVFKTSDPSQPWLGNFQGSEHFVPDGVYNYSVKAGAKSTSDKLELTGSIQVIR